MLPGANHARMIAKSGFDWVCVDTEHGNIAGMYYLSCIFEIDRVWFGYAIIYVYVLWNFYMHGYITGLGWVQIQIHI